MKIIHTDNLNCYIRDSFEESYIRIPIPKELKLFDDFFEYRIIYNGKVLETGTGIYIKELLVHQSLSYIYIYQCSLIDGGVDLTKDYCDITVEYYYD